MLSAATHHSRPLLHRLELTPIPRAHIPHLLLAAFHSLPVDQRTDLALLLQAMADLQISHSLRQSSRELLVDRILHEEPIRADARLARVAELRGDRAIHRVLQHAVAEHQERRVAPQLQTQLLHRPRRLSVQILANRSRACEGQGSHILRLQQSLPHLLSVLRCARHHVEHSRGNPRLFGEEGQIESGDGGGAGGFQHTGAADRESRSHLPSDHGDREVPGGDEAHDAHRLVDGEQLASGRRRERRDGLTAQVLRLLCKPTDEIGSILHLPARLADRLPALESHNPGQFFPVFD